MQRSGDLKEVETPGNMIAYDLYKRTLISLSTITSQYETNESGNNFVRPSESGGSHKEPRTRKFILKLLSQIINSLKAPELVASFTE